MKILPLLLLIVPLISNAQKLSDLVPLGSRIFVSSGDAKTEEFAKERLFKKHLFVICRSEDSADFILKFNIVGTSLRRFSGYADFIDKSTNKIVFSTKSVNSMFSTNNTGLFDYRNGVADKLINRRIYPEYKK